MNESHATRALMAAAGLWTGDVSLPESGWYLRDLAGAADAWSPEVFDLYGFKTAEVAPPADVVYRQLRAEDARRVAKEVELAATDKRCFDLQYNIQRQTGQSLALRNRGQIISLGGNAFVIGIVSEIARDPNPFSSSEKAQAILRADASCLTTESLSQLSNSYPKRSGLSPRQLQRVSEFMKKNLGERLSVGQMAQAAGVSCAHFSRTFKIATGVTPHRFLLDLRLAKARQTLLSPWPRGNLSLLAADLGFFDQAHLTKYFRKKYGQSPGKFLRFNRPVVEAIRMT